MDMEPVANQRFLKEFGIFQLMTLLAMETSTGSPSRRGVALAPPSASMWL